jgi:tetratricopeptide (TPR) repeat protein
MIKHTFIFWLAMSVCPAAFPHDSPEHEIETLTAKMAAAGKSADLLARRATEWRALGELNKAADDWREAITLEPRAIELHSELARVLIARGDLDEALNAVNSALDLPESDPERARLWMVRAEVHENAGRYQQALADCASAFGHGTAQLDWYLTHARLQTRCGKYAECAADLKAGHEKTGSAVVEIEWIEAMIDAGHTHEALARIETHLARARWRAGWLIRRARALITRGDETRARSDLHIALAELERRLNLARPDPTLIVERGLALALIGKAQAAADDLAKAKQLTGTTTGSLRLERALQRESQKRAVISGASS